MSATVNDMATSLSVRRQLAKLHDVLRADGHNPLEAANLLAAALADPEGAPDQIQEVCIDLRSQASNSELLAVGFQQFITSEARNGLGQYLTPPHVCDFIARLISRDYADVSGGLVLDPFSGVGILVERVGAHLGERTSLRGIEVNPAIHSAARAMCSLSVRDLDVERANSFDRLAAGDLPVVDCVVTNPPFGAAVFNGVDELREVLPPSLAAMKRLPAELLGLEVSLAATRPGGVIAIVLPQSVLTNGGWGAYRADLFRRFHLDVAVSLPEQTFGPFKGVARACILLGRKSPSELPASATFVRSRQAGYDETGRPSEAACDIDAVYESLAARDQPALTIDADGAVHLPPLSGTSEAATRLGDIADVFNGRALTGRAFMEAGADQAEGGAFSLQVGDLAGAFVSWNDRGKPRIPQAFFAKNTRTQLRSGDICMTAAAHKPRYIGLKIDLLDDVPAEGAMPSPEVLTIRLRDDAPISPVQLLVFLRSPVGYEQIQELVRGSTAHLYATDVKEMLIPDLAWVGDEAHARYESARSAFREYIAREREFLGFTETAAAMHAGLDV